MELKAFYHAVFGGLLDMSISGDLCVRFGIGQCLTVLQNFKGNRC